MRFAGNAPFRRAPADRAYGAIASPLLQMADNPSSVQPAPNLFTALEQQLGLRLVPEQITREYIVIDAIRRPDPN